MDVGACVALQFASLNSKPSSTKIKVLGFEPPTPLFAALILESPAIAPSVSLAATVLSRSSAPTTDPFYSVRRALHDVTVPTLVAVGTHRTVIDAQSVSVSQRLFRCLLCVCWFLECREAVEDVVAIGCHQRCR
jgi:hypothetical protein